MLEKFPQPDKYFKMVCMFGYTIQDFTRDIKDELIELTFPYVVLHLGTLQIGLFDSIKNYEAVSSFMHQVNEVSPNSYVLVSGLIPRPMDHPHPRKRCENYNSSYRLIVQELRRRFAFNVGFKDGYLDFLSLDDTILDREQNFDEGIFLSRAGARLLRSIWLRFLGFFLKKAMEVIYSGASTD